MDDAFSRFEADLANMGQPGLAPPPSMGMPPPGMHHPMMMGGPPGPYAGGLPPGPHMHGPSGGYPGPSGPPYYPPQSAMHGGPSQYQAPAPSRPFQGTIAQIRANQGLPVGGDHHDPDHGVPPMPKGMGDNKRKGGPGGSGAPGEPKKGVLREAAGKRWRDPTLDEWPDNDFRIFVGDLGNDVNDDALAKAFQKYPTFAKAKIVKDKRTKKSKGYGFVSFLESHDFAKALKEMQGKYIGNRPVKLRKSSWEERNPNLPPNKKQKK